MHKSADLGAFLKQIDGSGYKAYKAIKHCYDFDKYLLCMDHIQGDPYAALSKIRVRVDQGLADFPVDLYSNGTRKIAFQDYLSREIKKAIRKFVKGQRGIGHSGQIKIDVGDMEVLDRTSVLIRPDWVEARMYIGLPAAGRRVLGREAIEMLFNELPPVVNAGLFWANQDQNKMKEFIECVENQENIREQLYDRNLIGFVANGSILPRESGISQKPLKESNGKGKGEDKGEGKGIGKENESSKHSNVVPFLSPPSLQVTMQLKNAVMSNDRKINEIKGMGIPKGVSLIVGGGYHGKSTLLRAIEKGVYPHVPGDGREYVVTINEAVKIRAEDGRSIEKVNICSFLNKVP